MPYPTVLLQPLISRCTNLMPFHRRLQRGEAGIVATHYCHRKGNRDQGHLRIHSRPPTVRAPARPILFGLRLGAIESLIRTDRTRLPARSRVSHLRHRRKVGGPSADDLDADDRNTPAQRRRAPRRQAARRKQVEAVRSRPAAAARRTPFAVRAHCRPRLRRQTPATLHQR